MYCDGMSFLLDPPMLFAAGILLYFIGNKLGFERLAKMAIGLLIVLAFVAFSVLLYADVFRCVFPIVCNGMSGSEFMFHSNITGIYKKDVPLLIVIFLFALYPVWIYLGYASSLLLTKRWRVSKEVYSYMFTVLSLRFLCILNFCFRVSILMSSTFSEKQKPPEGFEPSIC